MFNALSCVPNKIEEDAFEDLFGYLCDQDNVCDGIRRDPAEGVYGAYGMCNPTQQLGWAMNAYYAQQNAAGSGASACDFSGSATLKSAPSPTGQCAALISEAGSNGEATVTSGPTQTGGSGSGSGSSSSGVGVPSFSTPGSFGGLQASVYLVVAAVSGIGMILL